MLQASTASTSRATHHLVRFADLPHDGQRLGPERPVPVGATLPAVQPGQADQRSGSRPGRLGRQRERALDPAGSLDRVTADEPVAPEAGDEPQRGLRVVRAGPAQRRTQVVVLARRAASVARSRRPRLVRGCASTAKARKNAQCAADSCSASPARARRSPASCRTVSSWRYREPAAVRSATTSDLSTRAASRPITAGGDSGAPPQTASDGGEGEPPGEHRQAPEQDLLRRGEQVVAPLERAAQGLAAGGPVGLGVQRGEGVAQPLDDLGGFEDRGPGCRQLQGQRHPVQPSAQVDDPASVLHVEREARPDLARSLDEQPDGREPTQLARGRPGRPPVAEGSATARGRCTRRGRGAAPCWWPARGRRGRREHGRDHTRRRR